MTVTVKDYDFGQYQFKVKFDGSAERVEQYVVLVYDNTGKPVNHRNGYQVRHFFTVFNESHIRRFCIKFVSDIAYRSKLLLR